jgi:hypothetical protein
VPDVVVVQTPLTQLVPVAEPFPELVVVQTPLVQLTLAEPFPDELAEPLELLELCAKAAPRLSAAKAVRVRTTFFIFSSFSISQVIVS